MKLQLKFLLACFLVIAMSGAGALQAGVIDNETTYIDVGHPADMVDVVSVDAVVIANLQAEVSSIFCSSTTAFGRIAEPVGLETGTLELPLLNQHDNMYRCWQLSKRKVLKLNKHDQVPYRTPKDGIQKGFTL